jgi:uncharacterized repeat protein (TIGR03809 family)
MADRPFTSPIPHPAEVPPHMFSAILKWGRVGLEWRDLAERRHGHYLDLYKSGRWKRYYTEELFRAELSAAIELAQRWATIAPRPEERTPQMIEPLPKIAPARAAPSKAA